MFVVTIATVSASTLHCGPKRRNLPSAQCPAPHSAPSADSASGTLQERLMAPHSTPSTAHCWPQAWRILARQTYAGLCLQHSPHHLSRHCEQQAFRHSNNDDCHGNGGVADDLATAATPHDLPPMPTSQTKNSSKRNEREHSRRGTSLADPVSGPGRLLHYPGTRGPNSACDVGLPLEVTSGLGRDRGESGSLRGALVAPARHREKLGCLYMGIVGSGCARSRIVGWA